MPEPHTPKPEKRGHIVFYGRGCAFTDEGHFVKESDFAYWQECCDFFEQVEIRLLESPYVTSSKEYSAPVKAFTGMAKAFKRGGFKSNLSMVWNSFGDILRAPKDAVHFFYFPNTLNFPLFLCALLMRRHTVTYWGNDWGEVGQLYAAQVNNSVRSRLMSHFYRFAQRFACRTGGLAIFAGKQLYDRYGPGLKHAIETKPFIMLSADDIFVRDDTCGQKPVNILYAGTFTARKGVLDIVPVMRQLRDKGVPVKMTMVGKGAYEDKLRTAIKDADLEEAFEFPGYIGDAAVLKAMFRRSDILFLPSYMEGFPRVIYEAMSQSLPVVCTRVGSIPARLVDRQNAMLCDAGDVAAMAEALEALISDTGLRQSMIRTNRQFFKDICSEKPAQQHARSIHEIFYEI